MPDEDVVAELDAWLAGDWKDEDLPVIADMALRARDEIVALRVEADRLDWLRAEALEQAAEACEVESGNGGNAMDCAAAIRSLNDKTSINRRHADTARAEALEEAAQTCVKIAARLLPDRAPLPDDIKDVLRYCATTIRKLKDGT